MNASNNSALSSAAQSQPLPPRPPRPPGASSSLPSSSSSSSSQSNEPNKIIFNPYATKRGRPPPTSWKRSRSSPTPDEDERSERTPRLRNDATAEAVATTTTTLTHLKQQQQQHLKHHHHHQQQQQQPPPDNSISDGHPQRQRNPNRSAQKRPLSSPPPNIVQDTHRCHTSKPARTVHNPYARRALNTSHSEDDATSHPNFTTTSNPATPTQYSFTQADIVQEANAYRNNKASDRLISEPSRTSAGQYSLTRKEVIQHEQSSAAQSPGTNLPSPSVPSHSHAKESSPYSFHHCDITQDKDPPSVAGASAHQQSTFRTTMPPPQQQQQQQQQQTQPQSTSPGKEQPLNRPQAAAATMKAPPESMSRPTYDRPPPSPASAPPSPSAQPPHPSHPPYPRHRSHARTAACDADHLPRPPHWKNANSSNAMMNRPSNAAATVSASRNFSFNHSNCSSVPSPRRQCGATSAPSSSPARSVGSPSSHSSSSRSNTTTTAANHTTTTTTTHIDPRQVGLPPALQFDPQMVQPIMDEHRRPLIAHAELNQPLLNGWTLLSHQKHAILFGLKQRRAILALDMGTGKTIVGCVWAKAFYRVFQCHIIVICPVSLNTQWQRTAQEATGLTICKNDSNASTATTTSRRSKKTARSATASSPSISTDHDGGDDTDGVITIASWAKIPSRPPSNPRQKYVVLADEAHSMQSMTAARTREALALMRNINCVGVLLLTGTPLKNGKPLNLYPLLKAVYHPLARDQRHYETHFCQGHYQQYGNHQPAIWKANGASNLHQLQQLTSSHILYLSKEQVLKELPPQQRIIHKVPVSHQRQLQHTKALQELAAAYHSSSNDSLGATGSNSSDAILGAIQRVRLVSSLAKMDAAVKLAQSVLKTEPAIVIFSSFVDVCKSIRQQLAQAGWECELLTGETPPAKRQDMVDRFQTGLSPVFVCTFGAGGVGLTLTAARTVLLVDRPWTPGEANQAEDRVRRIGQTKPVQSLWISAFDLDEQIDAILEQKQQTASAVLQQGDGKLNNVPTGPNKLSIHQLLRRILPPRPITATSAPGTSTASGNLKQTSMLNFTQSIPDD